jgi:DNA-binding LacI/PurR family transcriptional regulator
MAEVARLAGVSKPTVSRVLSGNGQVSVRTRERVLAAVDELRYHPNELARAFHRGRTSTISVVLPFVTHPSAVELVRGILEGLRPAPYPMTLLNVETPVDRDMHLTGLYSSRRPVGALIGLGVHPDQQQALLAAGIPTVLIEASAPTLSSVQVDNAAAGTLAARHLLELGHASLGFIGDENDDDFGFVSSAQRLEAFSALVDGHSADGIDLSVSLAPHGRDEARRAAQAMLSAARPPSAVFAASDTQALGVLDAARALGLAVPDDVSVLGCDDIAVAADLGLSSIHVGLTETGRRAAELLLWTIENPTGERQLILTDPSLRTRATTSPRGR